MYRSKSWPLTCHTFGGLDRLTKKLLILSCADRKRNGDGLLPALDRYDGPAYRVVRSFLRDYQWPDDVSIAVLSAKYGLFGVLKGIENYDKRMTLTTARGQATNCSVILDEWANFHQSVHVSLGKDYMPAVQPGLESLDLRQEIFLGGQGKKLHQIKAFLENTSRTRRTRVELEGGTGSCSYFLPDWDDLLDPNFDFSGDKFSGSSRAVRGDKHCSVLMKPSRMSDGVLLSLAQQSIQKGPLRKVNGTEPNALAPPLLRSHFGLKSNQYLFGDCGAFSYVNEDRPTISVDQAVALYESYGFDFGASVDHIPVPAIIRDGQREELSKPQRQERVNTTCENARLFIESAQRRKAAFTPVGTIQALTPDEFAHSVKDYYDFGYRHMAIGGLVPRGDKDVEEIVKAVMEVADDLPERPWIHLFGIYRPKLQPLFRQLKVDSFDSATYFRKAWLRSDQNYLSADGRWYAAIRVPMTTDGRTKKRLEKLNVDIEQLQQEEHDALRLLRLYDSGRVGVEEVLRAILRYDRHLARSSETESMQAKYRKTLLDRPWQKCVCNFCEDMGIHMLIFRGANRNKRRGAHNTLMLYGRIGEGASKMTGSARSESR